MYIYSSSNPKENYEHENEYMSPLKKCACAGYLKYSKDDDGFRPSDPLSHHKLPVCSISKPQFTKICKHG